VAVVVGVEVGGVVTAGVAGDAGVVVGALVGGWVVGGEVGCVVVGAWVASVREGVAADVGAMDAVGVGAEVHATTSTSAKRGTSRLSTTGS